MSPPVFYTRAQFERWLNKGWLAHKAELVEHFQKHQLAGAEQTANAAARAASVASVLSSKKKSGSLASSLLGGTTKKTQEEQEFLAACVMQRSARQRIFQKQAALALTRDMTEAKAAIILQNRWRCKLAMRKVDQQRQALLEHAAAVKLQTKYRVRIAKKQRKLLIEQRRSRTPSPTVRASRSSSPWQDEPLSPIEKVGAFMDNLEAHREMHATIAGDTHLNNGSSIEADKIRELREQIRHMRQSHAQELQALQSQYYIDRMALENEMSDERRVHQATSRAAANEIIQLRAELADFKRGKTGVQMERTEPRGSLVGGSPSPNGGSTRFKARPAFVVPPRSASGPRSPKPPIDNLRKAFGARATSASLSALPARKGVLPSDGMWMVLT